VRLTWTPPEGESREFVIKPWDLLSPDAEAIELVGGEAWTTFDEFVPLLQQGHRRAMRAALWIARRAEGEGKLRFDDIVLRAGRELRIGMDDDERAERRQLVRDADLDDDVRRELWVLYGGDPADLDSPDPKAPPSDSPEKPPGTEPADGSSAG
jgi:hypothetical protein